VQKRTIKMPHSIKLKRCRNNPNSKHIWISTRSL